MILKFHSANLIACLPEVVVVEGGGGSVMCSTLSLSTPFSRKSFDLSKNPCKRETTKGVRRRGK